MRKWWWWWLPGWRKMWKCEKRRSEAISEISGARLRVELMAQRPRKADDVLDNILLEKMLSRIKEIEEGAKQASNIDDLEDLTDDAELQEQFVAYLCPATDIQDEGELAFDLIEGWGVPKTAVKKLRELFADKLKKASTSPEPARGALRALFEERDSWADYADDYEETMQACVWWLFWASMTLTMLAVLALHFAFRWSPLLVFGILFAGAAGSCVSVMAKVPALDVSLAGELEAYRRRILSRIGVGFVASLIGCASLGWLPVSIQNQTFADAIDACTTSSGACSGIKILILLGVPMLLGFSERTLTSVEQRVFGNPNNSQKLKS